MSDTEPELVICEECGEQIDPDLCGCGGKRGDSHDGHVFVPLGCECLRHVKSPRVIAWQKLQGDCIRYKDTLAQAHSCLRKLKKQYMPTTDHEEIDTLLKYLDQVFGA